MPYSESESGRTVLRGGDSLSGGVAYNKNAVRPVIFLKSDISITGGDGSSANPYTLG